MIAAAETPQEAARRFSSAAIREGYAPEALHAYTDERGEPIYWRIRLRHPSKPKWIRPMHRADSGFKLTEPPTPPNGKPLYRLHEIASGDGPAWIVEGEKAADALSRLGVIATTSGAADSAAGADWSPLAGRRCIVWPDNDEAGLRYATDVAERLKALGCEVETLDATRLGVPAKGDAVDWLAAHRDATAADLDGLPRAANRAGPVRTEPEPLRRPVAPPEPYPLSALGSILAPAAESLQRVIQAPDAICGASLLAAASLAVQGLADVTIDGRTHPASLWMLTIAESGERKSAVDAEAMRPAREYEKALAAEYSDACAVHEALHEQWNAQREQAKAEAKKLKGEGLA